MVTLLAYPFDSQHPPLSISITTPSGMDNSSCMPLNCSTQRLECQLHLSSKATLGAQKGCVDPLALSIETKTRKKNLRCVMHQETKKTQKVECLKGFRMQMRKRRMRGKNEEIFIRDKVGIEHRRSWSSC